MSTENIWMFTYFVRDEQATMNSRLLDGQQPDDTIVVTIC